VRIRRRRHDNRPTTPVSLLFVYSPWMFDFDTIDHVQRFRLFTVDPPRLRFQSAITKIQNADSASVYTCLERYGISYSRPNRVYGVFFSRET